MVEFKDLKIGDVVEVKFKDSDEIYKGYVDTDEDGEKVLVIIDKDEEIGKWLGNPYWDIDCEWIKVVGKSKFALFKNIIKDIAQGEK